MTTTSKILAFWSSLSRIEQINRCVHSTTTKTPQPHLYRSTVRAAHLGFEHFQAQTVASGTVEGIDTGDSGPRWIDKAQ